MNKIFLALKSRTVWTIIILFLSSGLSGILPEVSEDTRTTIQGILAILAIYFRVFPRVWVHAATNIRKNWYGTVAAKSGTVLFYIVQSKNSNLLLNWSAPNVEQLSKVPSNTISAACKALSLKPFINGMRVSSLHHSKEGVWIARCRRFTANAATRPKTIGVKSTVFTAVAGFRTGTSPLNSKLSVHQEWTDVHLIPHSALRVVARHLFSSEEPMIICRCIHCEEDIGAQPWLNTPRGPIHVRCLNEEVHPPTPPHRRRQDISR